MLLVSRPAAEKVFPSRNGRAGQNVPDKHKRGVGGGDGGEGGGGGGGTVMVAAVANGGR